MGTTESMNLQDSIQNESLGFIGKDGGTNQKKTYSYIRKNDKLTLQVK